MSKRIVITKDFRVVLDKPVQTAKRGQELFTEVCGAVMPCRVVDVYDDLALVSIDYMGYRAEVDRPVAQLYKGAPMADGGLA